MMNDKSANDERLMADTQLVRDYLATVPHQTSLDADQRDDLRNKIKTLLKEKRAVLVAHYYTDPEIQALAEETGGIVADSLEMARFGRDCEAELLIVAGVRFMGETASILSPEKKVLMPTLETADRKRHV